jgi:Domain of unknown function (DUF1707)
VAVGPRNSRARAHGHLRAADADREQVVEILTAAFVQGRLNLDELSLRAGLALASRTYAELAATIDDLPAPPLKAPPPPRPARLPAPAAPVPPLGRMPASARAVVWAACVIVAVPAVWAAFLTYYGGFLILFLVAFTGLTLTIGTTTDRKAVG